MDARLSASLPEIMTAREAATTGLASERTFGRWARAGKIPAIRLPNGQVRFRRADIEALLEPQATHDDVGSDGQEPLPGLGKAS
ncbi:MULTISPECIES: helix-turn-helix domain-containing protein [unclassified Actinobaculum]|uniref:helix-turn-helix domain-containing protein n=1 Tax=unclassified Actinobaculum TaxID=2609299 RepID=UPI000D529D7D|nr:MULTISPECIES: helix-turn-helix domain-containing protein [unclassified Actinobaculum]AWE42863.1 hypothetical protein DDD63_09035 [Actinobaculum sp. 313]RTE49057.1 helix-turn-helix domain-containing protein [Actinobaculum sp. 352]